MARKFTPKVRARAFPDHDDAYDFARDAADRHSVRVALVEDRIDLIYHVFQAADPRIQTLDSYRYKVTQVLAPGKKSKPNRNASKRSKAKQRSIARNFLDLSVPDSKIGTGCVDPPTRNRKRKARR